MSWLSEALGSSGANIGTVAGYILGGPLGILPGRMYGSIAQNINQPVGDGGGGGFDAQAAAQQRANPLLQALTQFQQAQLPIVQRQAFAGAAERGFGLSGIANRNVAEATGSFLAQMQQKRQEIMNQALNQVQTEDYQNRQLGLQRDQLAAQRDANKPWYIKLFGG